MTDWTYLDNKTWPQLAACTHLARVALKKIDSDAARAALDEIERILALDWGPVPEDHRHG